MFPPAAGRAAFDLREATRCLSAQLDGLLPASNVAVPHPRPVTPQQMAALLSILMRAGQWLRSLPEQERGELDHLTEYREQVKRLRSLLPSMHDGLLRERARLEKERERVTSASDWARASRQTL